MATITVDRSINADDAFSMSGGTPCFVSLPTGSATYQSNATGYSTWVTGTIVSSSNWQSICYGNNIVVAVSSTSGTIAATSPAGVTATWTLRTLPATASWYAVAYGLDKFVAVAGGASTAGAYSADGAKWTSTGALTTSGDWRSLTFGNDRFVALSYNSTNSNYSTNGTSWTAGGALPGTRNWTSITYGEGTFVAVASGSTNGAYSTDGGVTWNNTTMPSAASWTSITYGNGRFVAVATGPSTTAAYSDDGITWNSATLPNSRSWVGVAFGNNVYTAIASGSTTGGAFSYDGIGWQAITTLSQTVACIAYTPTTWNSNDTLTIANNATVTVNTDQKKFWSAITLTNGKLVISNSSTSTGIRFTMGRVTGAAAASITPGSGIGDIEINGNWIELGTGDNSSGQTMTAPFTDYIAALWVETASGSGVYEQWLNATGSYGDASPVLHEGLAAVGSGARGKFFIQQANADPYGPTLINGTDGSIAQKLLTVTSTTGLFAGASITGPGIPASTVVNRVISSTLLEINANTTTEVSPDWSSVCYGNSTYVAVSKTSSNIAATSSDGVTWTKRTLPFVANWNSVIYGATSALFVAVASDGNVGTRFCATSPDGITWTRRAMPANMTWMSVATNGTSFVAVGNAVDGTATPVATTTGAYSADGITWTASTMSSAIWRSVVYGAGAANRYVAVSSTTLSNWDADGTGTWTNGGAMTSANYLSIAWNGTRFFACSGSSTVSMYSTDATTWTTGAVLANSTSRGVAWDGTNFVIVSTTNSVNTSRTPNGSTAVTNTTMASTHANNWWAICANGTTLLAVSNSSNLRSAAMTSTDSGANWTLQTGIPLDVSLTCFNPYASQLTNTVQFGDGTNGKKVPNGAKVRCPNIMFTSAVPANIQTSSRLVGANMVMTAGGSLTANICLFDESYNTFTQAESISLTNVGFSLPPVLTECYGVTMTSVGFALEPVRRYYTTSATIGSNAWFTRDTRYGNSSTNAWSYINNAIISDFNVAVGQPLALHANQTGSTVAAPGFALAVTNTENSSWTNIRFYGLNISKNFQSAISASALFNNNTITNFESYGLAPIYLGTSSGNNISNVTWSEDMFNATKNRVSASRIGNDPIAGAKLEDGTKYYLKTRSFRDWNNLSNYFESREYSATPFIGSQLFPQSLSVINTGPRTNVATWVRRDPTSATVSYTLFRGTTPGFTRNSSSRLYYNATAATVTVTNGFVATVTGSAGRTIQFTAASRTITVGTGSGASLITDGFVAGMNVVVAGTTSNDGTYMISSVAAGTLTLTTNHTNLVNEGPISTGTLNGQPPSNGTTYYYRLQKYDSASSGITNAAGTAAGTTLTIPSGSFNTGIGTIANCKGTINQNKIRIPEGSAANFYSGNVAPGMQISGGGVGTSATVVSIDTPWQITVSVVNASTFVSTTLSLGAAAGMYIYGPGIAWPTKVVSVDSATQITVDTAFLATFSGQTITFMHGSESDEFECLCSGPTNAAFNFLTQSDDFTNAAWTKTNMTATGNVARSPYDVGYSSNASVTTADRLLSTGPNGRAEQTITNLKSGVAYNYSVYVMTDPYPHQTTVAGEISINTTSPTTQSFTATGHWQRINVNFTATSATHTFKVQINTEGAYIYAATANVVRGSTTLAPMTNTTLKLSSGSATRTFTFNTLRAVHTITASGAGAGSFVTDGFVAGDSIIVYGSTTNDGEYVVTTVAATVLTINSAQPFVTDAEAVSTGCTITGSVLPAAAQEISLAAAWSRSMGGNEHNQGIELTMATAPTGTQWTEIYLGTASGFTPTVLNRVGYVVMPGSPAPFSLSNSNENVIENVTQAGYGGLSGALITLTGSSDNKFFEFVTDFNFTANTASVLNVQNLSNNNVFDDFTIKGWRNYIATWTPYTFLNNASGVTMQNFNFDVYDYPIYTSATNSALGVIMKGVAGANSEPLTTATTYTIGSTTDGMGVAFTTVYDTMFHEMYTSPTGGELTLRFNASAEDDPPYTILSGTPSFSNNGRLYFRTAGDSIEIEWPYRIYGVSSFKDKTPKKSGLDLGSNVDILESLLVEFSVDTGSGYSAYQVASPENLAATSVSTTTGFLLKLKLTARAGMLYTSQTNSFVVGEVIEGATSGATATVDEDYDLGTTGTIILSSINGTFLPGELVRRASDDQARATNVVTNTQFALFPSFNSYIDGLEIYTNTVGPGDYPGRVVDLVLTNVVAGSTYYVYKTSDSTLLGSGTASSSTVTISGVPYVADFNITIRVRKGSVAPKYLPLETQATVNSAGASVFISQSLDTIAS